MQHRAIREALAAGSSEGARTLAREHVLASGRLMEAALDLAAAKARPLDWLASSAPHTAGRAEA